MPKTKKKHKNDINAKKNPKFQIIKGARKKIKNKKPENDKKYQKCKKPKISEDNKKN